MSGAAISLIAAVAQNRVIGDGERLLWKLPSDLKRFRELSWGKPLVMGRKTFESIGRVLPGRETIIVTRHRNFAAEGAHVALDLAAGLALAEGMASRGENEIIIAGGGEIYAQTIGLAERLFITEVDLAPAGETKFPPIDSARWREVKRETPPRGERDEAQFRFVDYVRRNGAAA